MSEFRSALEALRAEVLVDVPDARIEEDFAELQRASELLELERLRRLREIERRGLHRLDGHVSAAAWLRSRYRVSAGPAAGSVRLARALEQMQVTREAVASGEVSFSAAKVLADVRGTDPEEFSRHEDAFVQAARVRSVSELERLASHWRGHLAQERDPVLEVTGRMRPASSMPRSPSPGWSGSTGIWILRPGRRCSPRSAPCSMPRRARGRPRPGPRAAAG